MQHPEALSPPRAPRRQPRCCGRWRPGDDSKVAPEGLHLQQPTWRANVAFRTTGTKASGVRGTRLLPPAGTLTCPALKYHTAASVRTPSGRGAWGVGGVKAGRWTHSPRSSRDFRRSLLARLESREDCGSPRAGSRAEIDLAARLLGSSYASREGVCLLKSPFFVFCAPLARNTHSVQQRLPRKFKPLVRVVPCRDLVLWFTSKYAKPRAI